MAMKKLLSVVFTAAMAASLVGCGSSSAAAAPAETSAASAASSAATTTSTGADTMNIELTTAPVGMHPLKTNDAPSTYVNGQIFETLYKRTLDGTSYEPLLAADMPTFSDDGLTATIPLREGVKFQDGTPFTSAAVAYMIDSLKDENYGSQRPSIVSSIESYETPDDNTIVLHLAYNDGVLVAKLAHTNGAIVNPDLDKSQDLLVDPTGAGTGPYCFAGSVAGSTYDLTANPDYWGGEPAIKNLHFDVIGDEATAIARLQTGEADFYPTVSVDSSDAASAISGYTAVSQPSSAVGYFALRSHAENAANPLMAEPDFRKAILEAIDTESFVTSVMGSQASFIKAVVPPSCIGYTTAMDDAYIGYNKEDAKSIIDSNGWTGQTITMLVSTRELQQNIAAYVQAQLAEVGITVNIVSEEWATFLSDAKNDGAFDISVLTWSNVTGDGQQMLEPNFSTTNGARIKYANADFDTAVENSAETTVLEDRQKYMLEAVQKIQGDAVASPIYCQNTLFCYNSTKFDNVVIGMDGQFDARNFKLK